MATTKDEVRKLLDALPDDATWEDVQHSLYVRERVERGRREADHGDLIEHDQVEALTQHWLER
ncbi:MAG: hypothetical protein WDO18_08895 [Acidobacteriota bacterium]